MLKFSGHFKYLNMCTGAEMKTIALYCKTSGNAIHVLKNKNYLMGITVFLFSSILFVHPDQCERINTLDGELRT